MALDLFNSLKVEEQPLMSLSEVETTSGTSTVSSDEDDSGTGDSSQATPNSGDLMPITDMSDTDDGGEPSKAKSDESNTSSSKPNSSSQSSSKKYAAIIKALHEKTGAFEGFDEEEFEDSPESFLDYLDEYATKNAEAMASDYIEKNLTSLQQKFVDMVENGISEESAAQIVKGYKLAQGINEDVLVENPDKAKQLYAEYLRYTTTFSEEKIQREVQKKEDLGTLTDDALESLPEFKQLLANAEREAQAELAQNEFKRREFQKRQADELKNYLEGTDEIAGIKLNKKMKDNWMREYSIVETQDGKKVNPILATRDVDPNKFDALLRLYHTMGLFKYDARKRDFVPDFTAIKSLGKTEAINELHRAVESDNVRRRTSGYSSDSGVDMDVEKEDHKKRWAELAKKLAPK